VKSVTMMACWRHGQKKSSPRSGSL
jgi:hypothetical protein